MVKACFGKFVLHHKIITNINGFQINKFYFKWYGNVHSINIYKITSTFLSTIAGFPTS